MGVLTDSQSATREDFTVFAVDGSVTSGPGGLGEYVAMYTPDGKIASFTQGGATFTSAVPKPGAFQVGTNVYCISVENLYNGPKGALRWHAVLRNCNTNGTFEYGNNGQPVTTPAVPANGVSVTNTSAYPVSVALAGGSGVKVNGTTVTTPDTDRACWRVDHANLRDRADMDVDSGGLTTTACHLAARTPSRCGLRCPAPAGLLMINESLSHGFHGHSTGNTPYVLDDTA